jgi:hypothetical protein
VKIKVTFQERLYGITDSGFWPSLFFGPYFHGSNSNVFRQWWVRDVGKVRTGAE